MDQDWTRFPEAETVLRHEGDARPAWLWSGDGSTLVWSNAAARLFGARLKSSGLKLAEPAQPIRGQIARIQRLGLVGRPLLSRVQFLAGRKPLSATCQCTSLPMGDARPHMLLVAVDPIAKDVLAAAEPAEQEPVAEADDVHDVGAAEISGTVLDHPAPSEADSDDLQDAAPVEDAPEPPLSSLIDKLASHEPLFKPLGEGDDESEAETGTAEEEIAVSAPAPADDEAEFVADAGDEGPADGARFRQFIGSEPTIAEAETQAPAPEQQQVENRTRYNFEELSRILNERIGREDAPGSADELAQAERGALVSLGDETPILNRLPLGILIFRDQDIVFVNRAMVDLTGYESATTLRAMGLGAVFPSAEGGAGIGPVSRLLRRDGSHVPVNARLQTVSWRGRNALMLTARQEDSHPLSETDVRAFAAQWASLSGATFFTADKIGLLTSASSAGGGAVPAKGTSLTALVAFDEQRALAGFLTLPARMAGRERPGISLRGRNGETVTVFAEGRAGIVSGYFGLITTAKRTAAPASDLPIGELARISRELRRPLSTISGFSELIAAEAFGPLPNPRYLEYARDINSAGEAITDLTDELEEFIHLARGDVALATADVDLGELLAQCVFKIRAQAGLQRVLVRSAISETLPLVRIDAATIRQAVLNMLASAIAQAGEGRKVVLSAQREENGAVSVHVRDSAKAPSLLTEHFVVFREGQNADGSARAPARSSIGLTLTRSLIGVNGCSFRLDPAIDSGSLMTLTIPASLVVSRRAVTQ